VKYKKKLIQTLSLKQRKQNKLNGCILGSIPGIASKLKYMWTNITDIRKFTGLVNIDTSRIEVKEQLDQYINTFEQEVFDQLLLNSEMKDWDLSVNKYKYLVNGYKDGDDELILFTSNGLEQYFEGIKDKLAYKIYAEYVQDQPYINTPLGDVVTTPGNGHWDFNEPKAIKVFNKFVDSFNNAIDFMRYYNTVVPETYKKLNLTKLEKINTFGI
jgi:hypothetical protein